MAKTSEEKSTSLALTQETEKLIESRMKQNGYDTADELVRAAIAFFDAGIELDARDLAAIEESEQQITAGQDLDWKQVSAKLRKRYLPD